MRIEECKNITIAYMRNVGGYGAKNEKLMDAFKTFLQNNNLLDAESIILGIALDNPATTPAEALRYDIGLIIKEEEEIPLNKRKLDDGTYAVFEVAHTREGVMAFWENVPQLAASLSIDYDKPIIERYTYGKITNGLCEFCVPLKQRL